MVHPALLSHFNAREALVADAEVIRGILGEATFLARGRRFINRISSSLHHLFQNAE
jgi:hypothetical protein